MDLPKTNNNNQNKQKMETKKEETKVATTRPGTSVTKIDKTASERFTDMVVREFTGTGGGIALTAFQKRLVQNYFINLDQTLKTAEEKRLKKDEKYRDKLEFMWKNVDMEQLALHVVACARIGFDPAQPNHINMIPYKNNTTNKFDIGFLEGYRGKELKARKYGLEIPDDVVVEIVYSNDEFVQLKKDKDNPIENYIFKIKENFNRGDVVGGFYYHNFIKTPQKNKLMVYSLSDIEKRKPEYASPEFWGGEKDKWEKDESTGKSKKVGKVQVDGWYIEMLWKTLYRAAFNNITIDSQKIDDDFIKLSVNEKLASETLEKRVEKDISAGENRETIDIPVEVIQEAQPISVVKDKPDGNGELPLANEKKNQPDF
jgi:recombination protein RecT